MTDGSYEAPYRALLATITQLRPRLHRYCARMTGSAMDGEDVAQEALFEAYRKLDQFDGTRPLDPWIFRIAHNRCVDFLRRRGVRQDAEGEVIATSMDAVDPTDAASADLHVAIERLITSLPPKERACVLLKDVLGYSLEEIAGIVESTVGGVKSALIRGRTKLAAPGPAVTPERSAPNAELARIVQLYVERFNRQDWDGVRELISADARLLIADRFSGPMLDSPYFGVYQRMPIPCGMAAGELDGEPVVIIVQGGVPLSAVRLVVTDHRISEIVDYYECPWILDSRAIVPG